MTKKITRATIKSFINRNKGNLFIRTDSHFDSMSDCVMAKHNAAFVPILEAEGDLGLGFVAHWCEGRTWTKAFESQLHQGYEISNCVGSYVLAICKPIEIEKTDLAICKQHLAECELEAMLSNPDCDFDEMAYELEALFEEE